jgi:hypothetical protein
LKWRAIINEHVRAFTRETAALRRGLESVFPSLGLEAGTGSASVVDSDADRVSAVKRLIVLASANNEAVQQSFSITANSNKSASVRTAQFWRSLATAETLAAQISQNRER